MVPTARERDGLALSSRNIFLTRQERSQAPVLFKALRQAVRRIQAGERSSFKVTVGIRKMISQFSDGKVQYVACVDASTLKPLTALKGRVLIALSVFFNRTRLIDNVIVPIKSSRQI